MTTDNTVKTLAVFDFDGTLIKGDSLWPFLIAVAGRVRCGIALAQAMWTWLKEKPKGDSRTFIKGHLLSTLLIGRSPDEFGPALETLRTWAEWLSPQMRALREHHAAGHTILIASGGLDLYLPSLLKSVPHNALLCTVMEVKEGKLTGVMSSGNCVRERKAELVAAYIAENGPFAVSWGYGNYPHDVPMLNLLQRRIIV